MQKVIIDDEFRALVLPVTHEISFNLQKMIATSGPVLIRVWKNIVLTQYEALEIMESMHIEFHTQEMNFINRDDAVIWICRDQLERKDICNNMRKYLIGRLYRSSYTFCVQKSKTAFNTSRFEGQEFAIDLVSRIAEEFHYSETSIRVMSRYTKILDEIYSYFPAFRDSVLNGTVDFALDKLNDLKHYSKSEVIQICQRILSNPQRKYRDIVREVISASEEEQNRAANLRQLANKSQTSAASSTTVKDMPAYDPDAEISSLALTVPSWGSSIQRVEKTADLEKSSKEAKEKLRRNLVSLGAVIFDMLVLLEVEM